MTDDFLEPDVPPGGEQTVEDYGEPERRRDDEGGLAAEEHVALTPPD